MKESDHAHIDPERLEAQEELRRTGDLLRAVADEVTDAIFVKDKSGKYLLFNKAASQLTGKPAAEVLGRDDSAIFDPESAQTVMERDRAVMAVGAALTEEEELTAAGITRTYLVTKAPHHDEQGNVIGVIGIARDITERKRTEAALREREELYRILTENANDFIRLHDTSGRTLFTSPSVERLNGQVASTLFEFANPDDKESCLGWWDRVLAGSEESFYWRVRSRDGAWRWLETRGSVLLYQGKPHVMTVCRDVTGRKEAEDLLRENERLFRQVLDALPVGVALMNPSGNIILGNPASRRVWGGMISEGADRYARSKAWWHGTARQLAPDEWASVRAIRTGEASANELIDIETYDGVRKIIRNSAVPIRDDKQGITGAVVVNEDVTEVLRLEEQLRQAQRMEAVGHLAGGIAHDFNNLLTVINGNIELIHDELAADSPLLELVREVGQAGDRAASLTRQLLAFSRKLVLEPKVLNLNALVTDTARMLRRLLGEDIDLVTVLTPSPTWVKADSGQLDQVLMNLAVNARDAMPDGGRLTIELANAGPDEPFAREYGGLCPGPYVVLVVSDTGIGMDDATKAHIFEPFFSSKPPGEGTGLGLATVYGIIKQSNGHVAVHSEPGRGTTFKIYLPLVEEAASQGNPHPGLGASLQGTETILLAEDEPALRTLARHVLQAHGYKVLDAGQSDEALSLAERYDGTIHLLVTDVVMPVMSGRQLAERLAAIRPGIKVLYISGHTDDDVIRHGVWRTETAFLQKPFTPRSLAAKAREVLDAERKKEASDDTLKQGGGP